jgi:D-alanyl-D-alanine carboxypeptidase (penicillin-binding protein 5/6)
MNKKSVLGLLLFSCIVIAGMFFGTMFMIKQHANTNIIQEESSSNAQDGDGLVADQDNEKNGITQPNQVENLRRKTVVWERMEEKTPH